MPLQPGIEPGDVIIVLQQKENETFQRRGNDLFVTHSIGITEALCGFQFTMKHLDGRDLIITSEPGKVIEPGMLVCPLVQHRCHYCFWMKCPAVL